MTNTDYQLTKARCLNELRDYIDRERTQLIALDSRLYEYVSDAIAPIGIPLTDTTTDCTAGFRELCGIRKVLRLMSTYTLNSERFRKYLRAIEGTWSGGEWEQGGLMFDTPRGAQHVRLMPYQVWCVFGIYGFDRPGTDLRLITEAHIFQTRKSGKTEFGAALDFVEAVVLGPANAQVLVCANSKEQAKIAFNALKKFAYQIDPRSMNKSGGKYLRVTADEMTFRPGVNRTASIKVMSAGGKKKDGLYASMVHADEHGSASYVKDHSDMQDLVEVCVGSMGPREERLTIHTTTAGLVNEGPYQLQLRTVEELLAAECDIPLGTNHATPEDDWFAFLLGLDEGDYDNDNLEALNLPHIFRRVNRSIGITVQPTWYTERLHKAAQSADTRKEVLTKDFNLWQCNTLTRWLTGDDIRPLQIRSRVDDFEGIDGWFCFIGCDFSLGDDINGVTYLLYNTESGEFFADLDAWISEAGYLSSPNRALYDQAIADGFLHICPGETIDDDMVTARIIEVSGKVTVLRIGYDPYSSMRFMNTLSAYIFGIGQDPKQYLVPVSQSFGATNGPVQDLTYMIKAPEPLIHLSHCTLWGWQFGNCVLEEDRYGNKRPFKASGGDRRCKIDNIVCLIMATKMYNDANGAITTATD